MNIDKIVSNEKKKSNDLKNLKICVFPSNISWKLLQERKRGLEMKLQKSLT